MMIWLLQYSASWRYFCTQAAAPILREGGILSSKPQCGDRDGDAGAIEQRELPAH